MSDPNYQEGYFWPPRDERNGGIERFTCRRYVEWQLANAIKCAFLVPTGQRHTAVQAGGNVGIFPSVFAAHFKSVITFEPDPLNFECLIKNLQSLPNVKAVNAALWSKGGAAFIEHHFENSGESYVCPSSTRPIDCVPLDDISLIACDLLQLDIEGAELHALEGAADTIYKHRPVIVLEINDSIERYGQSRRDIEQWMKGRDYIEVPSLIVTGRDYVFKHRSTL